MSDDESSSSSSSESEENVPKQPVKKVVKKKAPPTGPKKPLSAYMFFCKARRSVLKADNPEFSFTELGKALGQEWKSMDADDRKQYTELAEKDKVRYTNEGGGGRKRKKKTGGPKRPLSAYMFFSSDMRTQLREENPAMSFAELGKEIGQRWKGLTDKTKYNGLAEKDKKRYRDEVAAGVGAVDEAVAAPAKKAKAPTPAPVAENNASGSDDDDDDDGSGSDSASGSD